MKIVSSRIFVPIEVNGHELEVLLDTGRLRAPAVLSGQAARERRHRRCGATRVRSRAAPCSARCETSLYEEPAFGLRGLRARPRAAAGGAEGLVQPGAGNDSVIGYDVLAPFVIRIDYPHKRLWLRRVHSDPIRFYGADYDAREADRRVHEPESRPATGSGRSSPGSPAAKLGVRVGDVIVSSENNKAPPPDEVLHRILEGKELQVARKQGELWVDTVLPEEPQASEEPDSN